MGTRLDLHTLLLELVDNVYFQPPPSIQMQYPCIVYSLDDIVTDHADNNPYKLIKKYMITIIDQNPDSTLVDLLSKWKTSEFNRAFNSSGLNHFVFSISF